MNIDKNSKNIVLIISLFVLLGVFNSNIALAEECTVLDTYTGEILVDSDCDLFPDVDDNCPSIQNNDQIDSDNNGIGDLCEKNHENIDDKLNQVNSITNIGIESITSQDIHIGEVGGIYKIQIENNNDYAVRSVLEIKDIGGWGNYRIDPNSVIVIDKKETVSYFIYVSTNSNENPGKKEFNAILSIDDQTKIIDFEANLLPKKNIALPEIEFKSDLEIIILIIILILLVSGIIIGYQKSNKNE